MIIIESKENSLFKNVKKLKERKNRAREKKYIIEGFRLVEEGFKAGADIECLIIEEGNEQKANEFLKDYLTASKVYLMKKQILKFPVEKNACSYGVSFLPFFSLSWMTTTPTHG